MFRHIVQEDVAKINLTHEYFDAVVDDYKPCAIFERYGRSGTTVKRGGVWCECVDEDGEFFGMPTGAVREMSPEKKQRCNRKQKMKRSSASPNK